MSQEERETDEFDVVLESSNGVVKNGNRERGLLFNKIFRHGVMIPRMLVVSV